LANSAESTRASESRRNAAVSRGAPLSLAVRRGGGVRRVRRTPMRAPASAPAVSPAVYVAGTFPTAYTVTGSRGSYPAMTSSTRAASATVRVIGPMVSCDGFAGSMPKRLTSGSVGRRPTSACTAAGPRIDPPVSSPSATSPKLAAAAAPDPLDDPLGLRAGSYAFRMIPAAELT